MFDDHVVNQQVSVMDWLKEGLAPENPRAARLAAVSAALSFGAFLRPRE